MAKLKIRDIFLILSIITLACKDEFLLETSNYKPIMVVNGLISNEPGPYTIALSFDSPLPLNEKIHLEGCSVTLYENEDKFELLKETEPGKYVTSQGVIQGKIGNNYSITIITPDGNEYKTEPQEMKEPVGIDTLYAELLSHEDEDYPFGLPGYQFYIDTKEVSNQESYFLWNMIETYQYTADFRLHSILFDDGLRLYMNLGELTEYDKFYRCWKTQNSGYIFTAKTSNLTVSKIKHQPIHFVGTNSRKLQERYSLLLWQYLIDEEAYYYWKSIEDQTSQENFLVATQPYNIIGNIKNINNPDEPVYGYFTVASATQKRIFIDRPNEAFYFNSCVTGSHVGPPPIYFPLVDENVSGPVNEQCIDCRYKGGEITKPDFWIDK